METHEKKVFPPSHPPASHSVWLACVIIALVWQRGQVLCKIVTQIVQNTCSYLFCKRDASGFKSVSVKDKEETWYAGTFGEIEY